MWTVSDRAQDFSEQARRLHVCVAWDSAAAFRNRALGASIVPLVLVADPYGIVTEVLVGARPPEFVGAFLSSLGARAGEERRP